MKISKEKVTEFLSGRGFYLVLAACLIAVGVAAVLAYGGLDLAEEPIAELESSSMPDLNISSIESDGFAAGTEASEPYDKEEESSHVTTSVPEKIAYSFSYPVDGDVVKSFSDQELIYSKTYNDMRLHTACDILSAEGDPVFSCGNGVVTTVITDSELGICVEIDHGNDLLAYYCGLKSNLLVSKGMVVDSDTVLGYLGEVPGECADAPHLHLEFYKNGSPADPLDFILD